MALMTLGPEQAEAFRLARAEWEPPIREIWGIRRTLSDVDFEAIMDLTHGLDMTVIFNNGIRSREILKSHSLSHFQNLIRRFEISEVVYSPDSNRQMSRILSAACMLLRRSDCAVYENYSDFDPGTRRPLTLAEEQALKWATIHIAPAQGVAEAYGVIPAPYHFIERFNSRALDAKQLLSLYILMAAFGERDGSLLHVGLAQDFIEEAFSKVISLHRSGVFY